MAQANLKPFSPASDGSGTVMSECYLYGNWGLPEQKELGIIKGKCQADIDREIIIHNSNGHYGIVLDENNVPLISIDKMGGKISADLEVLKAENKKRINWCEDPNTSPDSAWVSGDWEGNGGTYTAETTIVNNGKQAVKMSADTDGHGSHTVFDEVMDFTVLENGEVSGDSDYIGFSIYISAQDKIDLDTAVLRVYFHSDPVGTLTNAYHKSLAGTDLVADSYNNFVISKSSFTQLASGDWSNITGMSYVIINTPSDLVDSMLDAISLVKASTQSSILPQNGGQGITSTDESTYFKLIGKINIEDDEYYHNVAIVTCTHDGVPIVIVYKNVAIVNDIELDFSGNRESVVTTLEFVPHYGDGEETTVPIEFYFYTSGTVAEVIA
jgi:hypothetical protein